MPKKTVPEKHKGMFLGNLKEAKPIKKTPKTTKAAEAAVKKANAKYAPKPKAPSKRPTKAQITRKKG